MAAPLAQSPGIDIEIIDTLVSGPYVEMTIKLMERFGAQVELLDSLSKMHVGQST